MESLNKMYFHCLKFHFFAVPFKTCLHAVILLIVFPTTKLAASQLTLTWLQWPLKIFFKQSYKKHLEVYKTHIFQQELELIISLFFIPVKETKPSQYSLCSTVYLTCGDRVVTWRSLGACVSYGLHVHVATPRIMAGVGGVRRKSPVSPSPLWGKLHTLWQDKYLLLFKTEYTLLVVSVLWFLEIGINVWVIQKVACK